MITLGLLRVGHREIRQRIVEDVGFAHIASEERSIARPRMRARQCTAAKRRISRKRVAFDDFANRAKTSVLEVTNVKEASRLRGPRSSPGKCRSPPA